MNPRWIAAAMALIAARAQIAAACGGDGDGSSSGSSGGSSGGGDGGGSYVAADPAPTCYDSADVHGYRTCRSYASTWAIPEHLPPISIELSTWATRVDLSDVDVRGTMTHSVGDPYTYRVVGSDLGERAMAGGITARLLGHARTFYAGIEAGVAAVDGEAHTTLMADGMTQLRGEVGALVMGAAVVGVKRPLGRLALGAELAAGGRALSVSVHSERGACETDDVQLVGRPLVEARVRAEVWLSPWITVGGYVGKDAVSREASGGLSVGGHLRAFDGGR